MRISRLLTALLVLSGTTVSAQVRVQPVAEGGMAVGGQAGAAGTGSIQTTGPKLDVKAPSLVPALSSPLSPAVNTPGRTGAAVSAVSSVKPAVLASPLSADVSLPASRMESSRGVAPEGSPRLSPVVQGRTPDIRGEGLESKDAGAESSEASALSGRVMFDGIGKKKRSGLGALFDGMRSWFEKPDSAPAFPAKTGDTGRIGGRNYRLGGEIGEFNGAKLYSAELQGYGTVGVLVYGPEARERMRESVRGLERMDALDLEQNRLIAADFDNGIVIQWHRSFNPASKVIAGRFGGNHFNGLTQLAAKLLLAGKTADLSPGNLIWDHWTSKWARLSGVGFRDGSAWDVLSQVFSDEFGNKTGIIPERFYSAVRARVGPDSKAWKKVLQEAAGVPELKKHLDALARRDAARPPPAGLVFEAVEPDTVLDDAIVTPRQLKKRLGYDPNSVKGKVNLHADDPGKLNTSILGISPPGKTPRVLKAARAGIIQNELFLRKVVKRWFSRYFDTPGSLAVLNGEDSYMVMEVAEGGKAWTAPELSIEQRAALASLVHTFGISDMNPGNLLQGSGRTMLIDFEQALSRRQPVNSRLGSTGLIDELPWVRQKRGYEADKREYRIEVEDFFPGVRDWRAELAKPETQAELRRMMLDSGFSDEEAAHYLAVFNLNAADLLWTIATDVEYARSESR